MGILYVRIGFSCLKTAPWFSSIRSNTPSNSILCHEVSSRIGKQKTALCEAVIDVAVKSIKICYFFHLAMSEVLATASGKKDMDPFSHGSSLTGSKSTLTSETFF